MTRNFTAWWLHPVVILVAISGGLGTAAFLIPETTYQNLWFTPKFMDSQGLAVILGGLTAFTAGALLPALRFRSWIRPGNAAPEPDLSLRTLLILYRVAMALALAGYAIWIAIAISRGFNLQVIIDVLMGKSLALYRVRTDYLGNIAGITTCTQFGVAAVVLGSLAAALTGWKKIWKSLALLFTLALLRAMLNTERLALIELIVPMVVVIVTRVLGPSQDSKRWLQASIKAAPIAGIGALFLVFASFEYFRSWASYYADDGVSFWTFAASRLAGYYVTAFNNGAYLADRLAAPMGVPFFTTGFLWRFPLLKDLMESLFPTFQLSSTYFDILQSGANAEFNNGGGLFGPLIDFGWLGALLYWTGVGALCGSAYRLFTRGSAWGLCLYPVLYLGIIDVPRGLYWGGGRATPQLCFLALSAFLLAIQQRRAKTAASVARG